MSKEDDIETRVKDAINRAMSRAFEQRDALVRQLTTLQRDVDGLRKALTEGRSEADTKLRGLRLEVDHIHAIAELVRVKFGEYSNKDMEGIVGKLVRVKGGHQTMVAASLDTEGEGDVLCVYEQRVSDVPTIEIRSIEVPFGALELVNPEPTKAAAKKTTRSRA